jgi:sensor c-di-GMP phosphodiesterase-like protein
MVVAEGIETAADAAVLLTLGVDYGQGWHYGRPGSVEDLLARDAASSVPAQGSAVLPTLAG